MADNIIVAFKSMDNINGVCTTYGSAMKDYGKYLVDNEEREKAYTDLD